MSNRATGRVMALLSVVERGKGKKLMKTLKEQDIYLVADVLGHKDVNTTKKHYAALEDDRRRKAAKYVHLRED